MSQNENMNKEIKAAVEEAIAPLKQQIETLKAQVAALSPLLKAMELPQLVRESKAALGAIPKNTLAALRVVKVEFDPKAPWFALVRADGSTISVKKTANDFRLRQRDQAGALLKEITSPFNGLASALKSLA